MTKKSRVREIKGVKIMEVLTAKDIAKKLGVKVSKVHEYRRASLIRMFRTGTAVV